MQFCYIFLITVVCYFFRFRYNAFAYVRCATVISPITAALFAGPSRLVIENEKPAQHTPGQFSTMCDYVYTHVPLSMI